MASVQLIDINKAFTPRLQVLFDIGLEIEDGEFLVLVGPSGCGKSTLLRILAGLETASSGDVLIDGVRANDLEPAERDIAMVFQNYALYPHMTVFKNLAYGLKNRGTPRDEIRRRVDETAKRLEIHALLDRKPGQLSGGQRQRVAMGRAIVRDPKVFLFDEPLSNLDARLRVQMRIEIKQLQKKLGTTSVYVTHDQVEAMTMADRLVVLNGGHMEQVGTPMGVYDAPASTFVARFIGTPPMNIVELGSGDGLWPHLSRPAGGPVLLGVRPEHLVVVEQGETHEKFRVEAVEPLGADTLCHGVFESGGQQLTLRTTADAAPRENDSVPLAIADNKVHWFEVSSGQRIHTPGA